MTNHYFEERKVNVNQNAPLAADIAYHLQSRQHLGAAVIVCPSPLILMSIVRKQWMKIGRTLQTQRASTLNTERILQLTYDITTMQSMIFTAKTPHMHPDASVFFLEPHQLGTPPLDCYTLYLATEVPRSILSEFADTLPSNALVVNYHPANTTALPHLQSKATLNLALREVWTQIVDFLKEQHISISDLIKPSSQQTSLFDDALDTLLNNASSFLNLADKFVTQLQFAQPITESQETMRSYEVIKTLTRRVQTLNPQPLSHFLTHQFNADNFTFHDGALGLIDPQFLLQEAAHRHDLAGRKTLSALLRKLTTRSVSSLEILSLCLEELSIPFFINPTAEKV